MAIEVGVFDSSVLVALITPEEYSDWVDKIFMETRRWVSLDLLNYEVANAIWKKYRKVNVLGRGEAYEAIKRFREIVENLFDIYPYTDILDDAFETAAKYDITVYDAAYIVLAKKLDAKYITLDTMLKNRFRETEYADIFITP